MNRKSKECIAMLLAGGKGSRLMVLTEETAKPAIAFGGKYRIIDFPLSNCVNSGIDTVGILTQYQPLELNAYVGRGSPWGLDRNFGGAHILPPYERGGRSEWYKGTANAVYQNIPFIENYSPEFVLILSGDHIYKMDYAKMLDYHKKKGSDCTIAVLDVPKKEASRFGIMNTREDGSVYEFEEKPKNPKSTKASMGVYIFSWQVLREYLVRDDGDPRSSNDFGKNVIPALLADGKRLFAYPFHGYWKDVGTLSSLWEANMDLLDPESGLNLKDTKQKIYARNYAKPSSYIAKTARIENSYVAEGCTVRGYVENSIISTACVIEENAVIRDSVIMPNATVKRGAVVKFAILGEWATVGEGVHIGEEREKYPKDAWGIAVVGKGKTVLDGAIVAPGEII